MAFTKKQKAEAIAYAQEHGVAAAAEKVGVSRQSIYNWIRESIDTEKTPEDLARETLYQAKLRSGIRRRLLERVDDLLERFDLPHIDFRGKDANRVEWPSATSGDVRSYATAIGILIDKYRLEMGEATGRTESIDLASAESRVDAEIERLSKLHDDINS